MQQSVEFGKEAIYLPLSSNKNMTYIKKNIKFNY